MKKLILLILCFVLAIFAVGCGTYSPPITTNPDSGTENPDDGKTPGGSTENENVIFTVTLVSGGKSYTPDRKIKAQWTGDDGIFTEEFNSRGVATCDKLDGDYRVTLSNLPDTFTYNPNGIYVDNDHPSVTVEILPINRSNTGAGTGAYNPVELRTAGTYRGILSSTTDKIWYSFKPSASGWYSLQSWVDIEANEINPIVDDYGTNAFNVPSSPYRKYDDGGASSTYTKNFRFDVQMAEEYTGNSWIFTLRAESVSDVNFPATVDFTIKYEDDWAEEEAPFEEQVANGVDGEFPYEAGYSEAINGPWRYNYTDTANKLLDGSCFKLWSTAEGGDGCYHLYDAATDTYGALLFAKITKDTEVFSTGSGLGFTDEELQWHSLTLEGEGKKRKDYLNFVNTYALYCNSDGAYPVTEELKQFLQDYAVSQRLFNDGNGIAETGAHLNSNEENQWLFACGYYKQ